MNSSFSIADHPVGDVTDPFLIAEIACAHDGDLDECRQLIQSASEAGADAIQLQVFRVDHQVCKNHRLHELLTKLQFSDEEWKQLFDQAGATGCAVSAFVYDEPSLELVNSWKPDLLKLNSADLNHRPMLARAARTGIPISLGTGASSIEEIQSGIDILKEHGANNVFLMHGVQDFPTNVQDARLSRIGLLGQLWKMPVAYADHTEGDHPLAPWMDLLALGLGASVLEKHIILDRSLKKTDYQASLEPDSWKIYSQTIRQAALSLNPALPIRFSEADIRYRKFQKKIAFSAHKLTAGQLLEAGDMVFMRSDGQLGISSLQAETLLNLAVPHDLSAGKIIPVSWLSVQAD